MSAIDPWAEIGRLQKELEECLAYLEWFTTGHEYKAGMMRCRGCELKDKLRSELAAIRGDSDEPEYNDDDLRGGPHWMQD